MDSNPHQKNSFRVRYPQDQHHIHIIVTWM